MSDSVSVIQRLHQHRAWVNENLLAAAATLNEDQLRRAFEIGQGSVWASLLHMYAAEFVWLESLNGNEAGITPGDLAGKLPGNQLGEGGITKFDELRVKWLALQERWRSYLNGLSADKLEDLVCRVSSGGVRMETKRTDVLLHVCTHAHYTAAQVLNMLRHVGCNPLPDTMHILMARREGQGKA